MKIKLFYIHPTNYGNLMMACVFMTRFTELAGRQGIDRVEYYLDVLDDFELERVKQSLPDNIHVFREDLYDRKRRGVVGKLEKLFNIPREIHHSIRDYDACVVLGGDCISQYYSKQVFISDMVKFRGIAKHTHMLLLGQTMGPFSGYAVGLIARCLKDCVIFLRDHACYTYMSENFPSLKLMESRDLAFLDIPFQNDPQVAEQVLSRYVDRTRPYITVVASGANRQYTSDEDAYLREYIDIIKYIIDKKELDVLLLAHVIHVADSNDKRIIDKLMSVIDDRYKAHIHAVTELLNPYEARILIGKGLATVTGRMHAAVSSINMGTVPICLSYSVKFKGVIGDDFDLNSCILQCRGDGFWADGSVHENTERMIDRVLENREGIVENIRSHTERVRGISEQQIQRALEIIQG